MSYAAGRWGWEGCFIIKRRINSPSKGRAILVKPKEKALEKIKGFSNSGGEGGLQDYISH
jgi:hypothetical protein